MERVSYGGWTDCVRLANGEVEAIVTGAVGPRVIRLGFIGQRNLFAQVPEQMGRQGESTWQIRGGHRFWLAPEDAEQTYELDNEPVACRAAPNGLTVSQPPGSRTHMAKQMRLTLDPRRNGFEVRHTLRNAGRRPVTWAPWALSVMAPGGQLIVPLPEKKPHPEHMLPNQQWILWPYTDLGDARWRIGPRYLTLRQNRRRGPNKLGLMHREGWVAYQLGEFVFIKEFACRAGADYPDGGVNFETFTNEWMLEVESLGPLVTLAPGRSVTHLERWRLHRGVPPCRTEQDLDRHIRPLMDQ
ncbi:MAG: DUF4380 domain-containing protein [Candidatus Marinimicrobia bacterium]|nr:DUF4380 domain-containing protein [Candidatus Neomarinimicrobiota bacterium]